MLTKAVLANEAKYTLGVWKMLKGEKRMVIASVLLSSGYNDIIRNKPNQLTKVHPPRNFKVIAAFIIAQNYKFVKTEFDKNRTLYLKRTLKNLTWW